MRSDRLTSCSRQLLLMVGLSISTVLCCGQMPPADTGFPAPSARVPSGAHPLGNEADPAASPFPDTGRFKRNEERQRKLVQDSQRLLLLANQLKTEVSTSGAATMTPDMLRKMDEIEKLARSVKDRMRN